MLRFYSRTNGEEHSRANANTICARGTPAIEFSSSSDDQFFSMLRFYSRTNGEGYRVFAFVSAQHRRMSFSRRRRTPRTNVGPRFYSLRTTPTNEFSPSSELQKNRKDTRSATSLFRAQHRRTSFPETILAKKEGGFKRNNGEE